MEDSVRAYATENPGLNYAALIARFGEPRIVAESYVEQMQTPELVENLRVGKRVICIVTVAVLIAVLFWTGVVVAAFVDAHNQNSGFMTEQLVEVERTER